MYIHIRHKNKMKMKNVHIFVPLVAFITEKTRILIHDIFRFFFFYLFHTHEIIIRYTIFGTKALGNKEWIEKKKHIYNLQQQTMFIWIHGFYFHFYLFICSGTRENSCLFIPIPLYTLRILYIYIFVWLYLYTYIYQRFNAYMMWHCAIFLLHIHI